MEKKIEKNAVKSHRERVDEMNKFLDSLSEVSIVFVGADFSIMICRRLGPAKDDVQYLDSAWRFYGILCQYIHQFLYPSEFWLRSFLVIGGMDAPLRLRDFLLMRGADKDIFCTASFSSYSRNPPHSDTTSFSSYSPVST